MSVQGLFVVFGVFAVAVLNPKICNLLIAVVFAIGCDLHFPHSQNLFGQGVFSANELGTVKVPEDNETTHAGEEIDRLLTQIALDSLPDKYEDTKNWGEQTKRWDGIKWRREGLKIESSRRWKMVNHGTWDKYSATIRNPEEEFALKIKNMHETDDGKIAFEILVSAHLNIDARQTKWVKGVQLYSVNARGHAKVRLNVAIEMNVGMGISYFPPDVILVPRATSAQLELDEFRIDRISKVGGEVAQQITKHARSKLDKKIKDQEQKIVAKINKQLEKKQDKFRLSIADAMKSRWTKPLSSIVPGLNSTTDR